jgi:dolichol-phosphate mannosyltransferase
MLSDVIILRKLNFGDAARRTTTAIQRVFGNWVPVRFVLFVVVGFTGIFIQLVTLAILFRGLGVPFLAAQTLSVAVAMTSNFYLNNVFTYAHRQLKGVDILRGLMTFYAACSLGAVVNISVAELTFVSGSPWGIASFLGAATGSVFNYGTTALFTWKTNTHPAKKS